MHDSMKEFKAAIKEVYEHALTHYQGNKKKANKEDKEKACECVELYCRAGNQYEYKKPRRNHSAGKAKGRKNC